MKELWTKTVEYWKNHSTINKFYAFLTFLLTIDAILSLKATEIIGNLFFFIFSAALLLFLILTIGRTFKSGRPQLCHNVNLIVTLFPVVLAITEKHTEELSYICFIAFQIATAIWITIVLCDLYEFIAFYTIYEIKSKKVRYPVQICILILAVFFGYWLSVQIYKALPFFNAYATWWIKANLVIYILVLPLVLHEMHLKRK